MADKASRRGRGLARAVLTGLVAVGVGSALPLGVAHADGEVHWAYVAQYESREGCEVGARRMGAANPGEWQCISNGNPGTEHYTWALYQLYYT